VVFVRSSGPNAEFVARHRIDLKKPWAPSGAEPDDRPAAWKAALGGPSRAWYAQGMAETLLALGAVGSADQYLVRAIEARGGHPRPLAQHAAVLRFAGQGAEADRILAGLPAEWREFSDGLCAPWLVEAGRSAEAAAVLSRLVERSSRNAGLRVALADACFQTGDYLRAREQYERAAGLGHDAASEWMKLGYACDKLGDLASAARAYRRSLERDPRQHQVWALLGNVLAAQNDRDGAARAFRAALEIKPDYDPARRALEALTTRP
jgi:Flp pilus assembly protein TadD